MSPHLGEKGMEKTFQVTPFQVLGIHHILRSKVCVRIFERLKQEGSLSVSAASTYAHCSIGRASALLRQLAELGVALEEKYSNQYVYAIKSSPLTELLSEVISLVRGCRDE